MGSINRSIRSGKIVRRYETIVILRPDLVETQLKDTLKRLEGVLATSGGHLLVTENWGLREMAYRIRREQRGQYFRLDYVAPAAAVNELERNLRLSDVVLRYLSVMTDAKPDVAALKQQAQGRAQAQVAEPEVTTKEAAAVSESPAQTAEAASESEGVESPVTSEGGVEQN
jgi:small subunit ribosomal protein S6